MVVVRSLGPAGPAVEAQRLGTVAASLHLAPAPLARGGAIDEEEGAAERRAECGD